MAHYNLGTALRDQGKLDEAVAELREAIRLQPDFAPAHSNLGTALRAQGKVAEAVAEHREAIRLQPDYAIAHANLGLALQLQGDLDGALAELRAARDRAGPEPERRLPGIGRMVAAAERKLRLRDRLAQVLAGRDRPAGPDEGVEFAALAYQRGLHVAAARLYAEALAADLKLADDRSAQHRYNAACAAALAGCGRGKDAPPPDAAARAGLRQQALGWLRAELAAWGRALDAADPRLRASIAPTLIHWKQDSDLTSVRDADALSELPEAERKSWKALWTDVDRLLERAGGGRR
jgi:serine/threonine-protein kinase